MKSIAIKMVIPREAVKELVERYVQETLTEPHTLKDWTVHRDGSIGITCTPTTSEPALPLGEQP